MSTRNKISYREIKKHIYNWYYIAFDKPHFGGIFPNKISEKAI